MIMEKDNIAYTRSQVPGINQQDDEFLQHELIFVNCSCCNYGTDM